MSPTYHTSHARYDLWYHLVFPTKYRKKVFEAPYAREKVKNILRAIAAHYDMRIDNIECLSDHVHMTISAPPRIAPARAAQVLKSVSTKILFQEFPWLSKHYWGGEVWAGGYFVRSLGVGVTKATIEQYIREQSEEL
jgi:putative transposase